MYRGYSGARLRGRWILPGFCAVLACGADSGPIQSPSPPPISSNAAYRIAYGTYLGGSGFEEIREPLLLNGGRLLIGARTLSQNMPTTAGAFQRSHGGGQGDSYLAVVSADGRSLEAATFFGGSGMERPPYGIEVASNGDVVFASGTTSPNIPGVAGAYRPNLHNPVPSPGDGYVCRISGSLQSLRWCTYVGGAFPRAGLTLDPQDNVFVAGTTTGAQFSTTAGAVQTSPKGPDDAFILKLSADGRTALASTRLGGTGTSGVELVFSIRLFPNGDVSVTGLSQSGDFPTTPGAAQTSSRGPTDAYVARLNGALSSLIYSSMFSGSKIESGGHRHWVLPDGSVLISGNSTSPDLPGATTQLRGPEDGYVFKVNPSGSGFAFTRYLGGSGAEMMLGPEVDAAGRIYVFGSTTSQDFPVTADAIQASYGGGPADGFFMILEPNGQPSFATYLGGSGDELVRGIALGPAGEIYLVGRTTSNNFPVTEGALQRQLGGDSDGFVIKLVPR
jgi:hypothetical protein